MRARRFVTRLRFITLILNAVWWIILSRLLLSNEFNLTHPTALTREGEHANKDRQIARPDVRYRALKACPSLILRAEFGLSNRLRAYAAVAAYMRHRGCRFTLVWPNTISLDAPFLKLFHKPDIVKAVFASVEQALLSVNLSREFWNEYNLLELHDWKFQIAVHADAVLIHSHVSPQFVNYTWNQSAIAFELEQLTPVQEVQEQIKAYDRKLGRLRDIPVAVHIRMNEDFNRDIPGLEKDHALSDRLEQSSEAWLRRACHVNGFIEHIKLLVKSDGLQSSSLRILVASDTPKAVIKLQHAFGEGAILVANSQMSLTCLTGASARKLACTRHAIAEQRLLTKPKLFIYSRGSSFSTIILWLRRHRPRRNGCQNINKLHS